MLRQIRHDPRTIALLLVVPAVLLVLLRYVFDGRPRVFQAVGAPLCGLFPFIVMFLVTSIAMLRERTTGTLERLMTLPLAKLDLLAGYALAFGRSRPRRPSVVCLGRVRPARARRPARRLARRPAGVGNACSGMALGLFVSAFARTEFQAVQFMPASSSPSCCCAASSSLATRWPACCSASRGRCRFTYAYDALARATRPGALGAGSRSTSP